jgi:molecular chaperone GrpE
MENQTTNEAPNPQAAADGTDSAPSSSPELETVEQLRARVETLTAEKEDNLRGWQRAQADFVNFRRRADQERAELIRSAEAGLVMDLLPVIDDFDRALAGLPAELRGLTWVDGMLLIERKLRAALEQHGVTAIDAIGKEFDPHEHEAVLRDGDPGEATTVVGELQKGYRIHDRVLRPTLVKVGPPANPEDR